MLPVKPSQTMTSARAAEELARFEVADERDRRRLPAGVRLADEVVALAGFLADRQQPDAGLGDAERDARVRGAHHAELHEMLRPAVEVGAGVEQHGRAGPRRQRHGQRGTIDAGQHAERRVGRQERRRRCVRR